MTVGYELRGTDDRGEGIFATRSVQMGEMVMIGVIECEIDRNHSHASQVNDESFGTIDMVPGPSSNALPV